MDCSGHSKDVGTSRSLKRFNARGPVDQYFEFSCSLGLDYSGEWEADPQRVHFTILDATIGLDPATLPADDLGAIRVTPAPSSRIYNKPADSSAALTDVYPAEPPLRGSHLDIEPKPGRAERGKKLCDRASQTYRSESGFEGIPTPGYEGYDGCGFGELTAPKLMDAYVGDPDSSGSWTAGDHLKL